MRPSERRAKREQQKAIGTLMVGVGTLGLAASIGMKVFAVKKKKAIVDSLNDVKDDLAE
jgi:hypothetical protein